MWTYQCFKYCQIYRDCPGKSVRDFVVEIAIEVGIFRVKPEYIAAVISIIYMQNENWLIRVGRSFVLKVEEC